LLQQGAGALSDTELLAIFLRTGLAGCSALDLARSLLQHFGSLRALLAADRASFCSVPGLGDAKYAQLQATLEMALRYLGSELREADSVSSPDAAQHYLRLRLDRQTREVFAVLFLDTRHRVIAYDELFYGTIDGATVHPREVVAHTLRHNAAALILAHNHPSGIAEPSQADIRLTRRLREALSLVDVRLLDHIIVGHGHCCSLAERGLLG
jgi:DNA repair protein RadC